MEEWTKTFTVDEETFSVTFFRRPFREGVELVFTLNGEEVHLAELGYGEQAALERLAEYVRSRRRTPS